MTLLINPVSNVEKDGKDHRIIETLKYYKSNTVFRRNMQSLCYAVYFLHGPFFIGYQFHIKKTLQQTLR